MKTTPNVLTGIKERLCRWSRLQTVSLSFSACPKRAQVQRMLLNVVCAFLTHSWSWAASKTLSTLFFSPTGRVNRVCRRVSCQLLTFHVPRSAFSTSRQSFSCQRQNYTSACFYLQVQSDACCCCASTGPCLDRSFMYLTLFYN